MHTPATKPATVLKFTLAVFVFGAVNWMIMAFLPVVMRSRGLTDSQVGTVIGVFSVATLAIMVPIGVLADLFSPRRLVLAGSALLLAYMAVLLRAGSYWAFLLAAALGGVAAAGFSIVMHALFLKTIGRNRIGRTIAFYQSGTYLAYGVGPALAGLLLRHGRFEPLLAGAAAGALVLIALVLVLPDSPTIRLDLRGYHEDLRQGRALLFLLFTLIYTTHAGVEQTSFTLLMKENLHFPTTHIGLVYLAVGCWMACLVPLAGHRFDRRQSIRPYLLGGLLLSGVFQILTPLASSFPGMLLIRLVHTVGDLLLIFSTDLMTAAFFPGTRLGGSSAVVQATRTCGVLAGSLGAGYLNQAFGYRWSFTASGVLLLALVVLGGSVMGRRLVVGAADGPGTGPAQGRS